MLRTPASLSSFPASTWAALPAAASAPGVIVRVTDYGMAGVGMLVISDGTFWKPLGPQVLFSTTVAAVAGANIVENTLATINVPAGLMGLNGLLRIRSRWTYTNGANNKTLRVRFGGAAGTAYTSVSVTANTGADLATQIGNLNAQNSQKGSSILEGSLGFSNQPLITSAVDTSAATTVVLSGQKASAGDTLTLEAVLAEILPGA